MYDVRDESDEMKMKIKTDRLINGTHAPGNRRGKETILLLKQWVEVDEGNGAKLRFGEAMAGKTPGGIARPNGFIRPEVCVEFFLPDLKSFRRGFFWVKPKEQEKKPD